MKTQRKTLKPDMESIVVNDLRKSAVILMTVLDRDTEEVLTTGNYERVSHINANFRVLAALNEVLIYYGDPGVFADESIISGGK